MCDKSMRFSFHSISLVCVLPEVRGLNLDHVGHWTMDGAYRKREDLGFLSQGGPRDTMGKKKLRKRKVLMQITGRKIGLDRK